jgi:hypothetical protein
MFVQYLYERLTSVLHAWRKEPKSLIRYDGATVEGGGQPQMEGVVGHTSKQDEPTVDEGKVTMWAIQIAVNHFILSPYFGNDPECEGVCSKEKEGEADKSAGKCTLVCRLVESKNSGEIRDFDKVFK